MTTTITDTTKQRCTRQVTNHSFQLLCGLRYPSVSLFPDPMSCLLSPLSLDDIQQQKRYSRLKNNWRLFGFAFRSSVVTMMLSSEEWESSIVTKGQSLQLWIHLLLFFFFILLYGYLKSMANLSNTKWSYRKYMIKRKFKKHPMKGHFTSCECWMTRRSIGNYDIRNLLYGFFRGAFIIKRL